MAKLFVNDDGEKRDYAFFDGYSVGDTLLEGCMFKCTIVGDKIEVAISEKNASYFSGLNQKKWLAAVAESVNSEHADSFAWDENGRIDAYLEDF